MAEWIGMERRARRCYGFDEIALVPGVVTYNPTEVDTSWKLAGTTFKVTIIASAMDGVVDVDFAIAMGKLGGLAVLNLDGVQTRYEHPDDVLAQLTGAEDAVAGALVQKLYKAPIKEKLVAKRVAEIKKGKVPVAVSTIPQHADRFGAIANEAGADFFVVQSTVTTARHVAKAYKPLDFKTFIKKL